MRVNEIITGDCLEVMADWPDNQIDTIICDPPYGIGFMGKDWDTFKPENTNKPKSYKKVYKTDYINGVPVRRKKPEMVTRDSGARRAGTYDLSRNAEFQAWFTVWGKEALRVLKPGGTLLIFGGTRTYHRLACGIEDAGFIIKDCLLWIYGSGFPKATDISKQLDKAKGTYVKGEISPNSRNSGASPSGCYGEGVQSKTLPNPQSPEAQLWNGWKSHGLKPAYEPILVAMKANDGTYANNALKHGVSGLNIDGGRIDAKAKSFTDNRSDKIQQNAYGKYGTSDYDGSKGRFPANVLLDEEVAKDEPWKRYFYCAKSSKAERNKGCEGLDETLFDPAEKGMEKKAKAQLAGANNDKPLEELDDVSRRYRSQPMANIHPTVKPLALMEYLCRLTKTPTGGLVLDCFAGSGSTCVACINEGRDYIGIEKDPEYAEIARRRIKQAKEQRQGQIGLFE